MHGKLMESKMGASSDINTMDGQGKPHLPHYSGASPSSPISCVFQLEVFRHLFNAGVFAPSITVLEDILEDLQDEGASHFRSRVETLIKLVTAYGMWDAFKYGSAYHLLGHTIRESTRLELDIDIDGLKRNLQALNGLYLDNGKLEIDEIAREHYGTSVRMIVDMAANAGRRAGQGLLEDAAIRFYKALEMIAQIRLARVQGAHGTYMSSKNFQWKLLPSEVWDSYREYCMLVFRHEPMRYVQNIGLFRTHLILIALRDPVWGEPSLEELREFKSIANIRNKLRLMHGKRKMCNSDIVRMRAALNKLLSFLCDEIGEDYFSILQRHSFVELNA